MNKAQKAEMVAARKRKLQWQAEEDARTLARYQEILQDKKRAERASKEASKQAKDLAKRSDIMKKASKARK